MPTGEQVTPQTNGKRVRGAQPGNRNAVKHGSHGARRDMRALVRRQNDRRTMEYRDWQARLATYLPHLGGAEALSMMERRQLAELVRLEQRVDALGAWLDAHQLVYGRGSKARAVPVLSDHLRLVELARTLRRDLGLRRRTIEADSAAPDSDAHQAAPEATGATQ